MTKFAFKLGKQSAMKDSRVPVFSMISHVLPPPPLNVNWFADVPDWCMLGNDAVSDCVQAAVMHFIMQQSAYLNPGKGLVGTLAEALEFYAGSTGFDINQTDPQTGFNPTDNGSVMLGRSGVMQYWLGHGVTVGGVLNRCNAFLSLNTRKPVEWRQSISTFGGFIGGIQLPCSIVDGDKIPEVWDQFGGPIAGGHMIFIPGYETMPSGLYYDVISWPTPEQERYKCTERFLQHCIDEGTAVFSRASIDARGVNAGGLSEVQLLQMMATLRAGG